MFRMVIYRVKTIVAWLMAVGVVFLLLSGLWTLFSLL